MQPRSRPSSRTRCSPARTSATSRCCGATSGERKGDNLAMLAAFDGLNRLFGLPGWAAPLRALGLRAVEAAHPVKRLLMQKGAGPRSRA